MRLPASSIQVAPSPHFPRTALHKAMSSGEKCAKSYISPAGSAALAIRIEEIHEEDVSCLFPNYLCNDRIDQRLVDYASDE